MIIGIGAEAIIDKKGATVIKQRNSKGYRIKQLDEKLRTQRTRREAKLLKKMQNIAPNVLSVEKYEIQMEYINGYKVSEILDKHPIKIAKMIGEAITTMHNNHIIHGDLTTSNMIVKDNKLYLIDFGLGFVSPKVEHKAVDIHLLRQSLISRHYKNWETIYKKIIEKYNPEDKKQILSRLEKVENRGRNKSKKTAK